MSSPKFKVGKEVRPRKKHQKGDMPFKNLMETLKFPEKIRQC